MSVELTPERHEQLHNEVPVANQPNENKEEKAELEKRAAADLEKISNGYIGDIRSVDEGLDSNHLVHEKVDVAKLPENLRNLAPDAKTWGDVSKKAADAGWKKLDSMLAANLKGDFKNQDALLDMITGKGSQLNTANVIIKDTPEDRLKETKELIKKTDGLPGGDKLSVAGLVGYTQLNKFDTAPRDEAALMKNYELVAKGKTDGISEIANALNSGKVKTLNGDVLKNDTKVNWSIAGPEVLKHAPKDEQKRKDMNYGQLLDVVAENSRAGSQDKKTNVTAKLEALATKLDGVWPDTAGNDRRSIVQTLESVKGKLDFNDPNSFINEVNNTYGEIANDLNALKELDLSLPANKEWMAQIQTKAENVVKKTGAFFEAGAKYMDQAKDNLKNIENAEEKQQISNIVSGVFSGMAAIGSIGFGWSNGAAIKLKQGGFGSKTAWTQGNGPAFFGSNTLFANNLAQTALTADRAKQLENLKKVSPDIAGFADTLKEGPKYLAESMGKLIGSTAATDYYINNKTRYDDYIAWARDNKDKSSIFGNGNDSEYKGAMPYRYWQTGEYAKTEDAMKLYHPPPGGRGGGNAPLRPKDPPPPDWAK